MTVPFNKLPWLLLRMINFKVQVEHPHKYLLHYLKSLKEWFSPDVWDRYPVAETSWSILQDFYHDPNVVRLDNALISLGTIHILRKHLYSTKLNLTT